MGVTKWITGVLGWAYFGPLGGLIGFLLGSAIEQYIDASHQLPGGDAPKGGTRTYSATEQRNSFFVSLLVLSSAVMKADGKIHPAELDCVRAFFRRNFGDDAAAQAMHMLEQLNAREVNIYQVGDQIAANMNYSQRLQLFHYLVQIATSDGTFSKSEKSVLEAIGTVIRLGGSDVNSVIAMFYRDAESAYAVLEILPTASNDEVRAAYRRMAGCFRASWSWSS